MDDHDPDALNLPDDGYPAPGTDDPLGGCAGAMFSLLFVLLTAGMVVGMWIAFGGTR